jgi:hypothetical protein
MHENNRDALLSALREQRRRQGWVEGIMTLECPATSCPMVGEMRLRVRETVGGRLLQPPMKCRRAGP